VASFFNKMKKGVNDAGSMAKAMVDANRFKMQISQLKKEIETKYIELGKLTYVGAQNKGDEVLFFTTENEGSHQFY
jgi:hypothetical protein